MIKDEINPRTNLSKLSKIIKLSESEELEYSNDLS